MVLRIVNWLCSNEHEINAITVYNKVIEHYFTKCDGGNWRMMYQRGIDSLYKIAFKQTNNFISLCRYVPPKYALYQLLIRFAKKMIPAKNKQPKCNCNTPGNDRIFTGKEE